MVLRPILAGLVFFLAAGGFFEHAVAQTTQPPKRPAAAAPVAPVAPVQPAPAAEPAPVAEPAAAPSPYRTEILNIEAWVVTCQDFAQPKPRRNCTAQLRIARQGTTQIIMALTLVPDESGHHKAILTTPTGISVAPGVELAMAGIPARKLAFETCDASQCTAVAALDDKLIKDLTGAANVDVILTANTGSVVKVGFLVKGFDKAYAAMLAKP